MKKCVFIYCFDKYNKFSIKRPEMEGVLNRIWALIREGRLLNLLDYQGALIREGRLKGARRLFESLRYVRISTIKEC